MTAFGQYEDDDSASTLKQRDHKDATDLIVGPSFGMIGASGQEGAIVEEQPAITASHGQPGNVAIPTGTPFEPNDGVSYDGMNQKLEFGVHRTLRISMDASDFVVQPDVESTLAPSLTASNDPSRSPQSSEVTQQVAAINSAGYGVRRLTPVECERLQSFPDGWTEPAVSDSARYKAMGNAVTVNVVRWILGRLP